MRFGACTRFQRLQNLVIERRPARHALMVDLGAAMLRSTHREGATMKTLALATILALGLLAAPLAPEAQQSGKVWRIGYLGGRDSPIHDEFRTKLRELGYNESQNILVEYRWYEGRADRAREQAVELVRLGVDVLVATGPPGFEAAKEATASSRIPVVMAGVVDPVGSGFVASLARPGGHITGVSWDVDPGLMSGKVLQLLLEVVPRANRLAALWNPDNKGNEQYMRALDKSGRSVGVQVQSVEVRRAADLRPVFRRIGEEKADALVILADPLTVPNSKEIVT
jgi:putative tryptophan/tyrosine transport system substrate-binding protein